MARKDLNKEDAKGHGEERAVRVPREPDFENGRDDDPRCRWDRPSNKACLDPGRFWGLVWDSQKRPFLRE
jgi:hypothetical protein